jgi:serine/threonine protein kinase
MKNIPAQVGNFIIKDEIDSGAFSVCHFAEAAQAHHLYCVKIVSQLEGSKLEFEILSKILHPNIVSLIKVNEFEDFYFIFMELCEGSTLLDVFNTCAPLSEDDAKNIFEQLVSALEYLHSKRISHWDIKLENIIRNDNMKIKLIDFEFSSEENIQTEY